MGTKDWGSEEKKMDREAEEQQRQYKREEKGKVNCSTRTETKEGWTD